MKKIYLTVSYSLLLFTFFCYCQVKLKGVPKISAMIVLMLVIIVIGEKPFIDDNHDKNK